MLGFLRLSSKRFQRDLEHHLTAVSSIPLPGRLLGCYSLGWIQGVRSCSASGSTAREPERSTISQIVDRNPKKIYQFHLSCIVCIHYLHDQTGLVGAIRIMRFTISLAKMNVPIRHIALSSSLRENISLIELQP